MIELLFGLFEYWFKGEEGKGKMFKVFVLK